ncbi:S1 family peptidase [Hyphomonas johnsonii]|uniref:Trypsin domain-containing protein n=1 Tax=Hyphomonas johnsonii MHS-2 TaxID=1280950 RepID=A0A059FJJ2_9PROT|nr:trypsin-like serine protease [Hyphomonas johnsonii]KCZ90701.1 trypsin domain-containing protein [Hyphomonas johnsonii MHS-2]
MKRPVLFAAAAALLALSACDAVRVPGVNPVEEESADPVAQLPDDIFDEDVANSVEVVPEAPATVAAAPEPAAAETVEAAAPASDTPLADETGTDTDADASVDAGTDADADASGEPSAVDDASLQPESLPALALTVDTPLPTLASLNAGRCGLPAGAAPTPTVASLAGAPAAADSTAAPSAVNGLAASLASFPGIVKLEPRGPGPNGTILSGHCSATRIAPNWFVTAAHCVDDPYDELRIIGDAENLRSPLAKVTSGKTAVCHAGYKGTATGYANDIALIRLDDDQVAPIADVPIATYGPTLLTLAPANYPTFDMAGWGITHYGGQLSNALLTTTLANRADGPAVIDVASAGGAGPCVGDSGGPLYVTEADGTRTVVGVLSVVEQNRTTGEFCAGDYNGRYTNLQGYMGWITSVMALCDARTDHCR